MLTINLNYDSKFDILYARSSNYSPSYGDEVDGIVTLYSIESDEITGMIIYSVKKRLQEGSIDINSLPFPLDLTSAQIRSLISKPDNGFKCTLQLS